MTTHIFVLLLNCSAIIFFFLASPPPFNLLALFGGETILSTKSISSFEVLTPLHILDMC